jgi:hypothetical protein
MLEATNLSAQGASSEVLSGQAAVAVPKAKAKAERYHFLDSLRGFATTLAVIHHTFTSYIY